MTEQEMLALDTPEALDDIADEMMRDRPKYCPKPSDIARECQILKEKRIRDLVSSGGEKYRTPYVPKVVGRGGTRRHGGIHSSY